MSKYSTQLRYICEVNSGLEESVGYSNVNEVISKSRTKIFSFDYPIFDKNYREILETKILKHYYTQEIGFESTGVWHLKLETKMNEIMPYYNKLYESEKIKYNPLFDTNITRTYDLLKNNTTTNSSDSNVKNVANSNTSESANRTGVDREMYSDTPQGSLTNVENETYLTNATKYTNTDNRTSNIENDTTKSTNTSNNFNEKVKKSDEYTETSAGKRSDIPFSEMIMKYRKSFLNIDMMIIDELANLFMLLW